MTLIALNGELEVRIEIFELTIWSTRNRGSRTCANGNQKAERTEVTNLLNWVPDEGIATVLGLSAAKALRQGWTSNSVLVEIARVTREYLWVMAEELAELVDSHDVLVFETSAFWRCFCFLYPVVFPGRDRAAGNSWAFGAEFLTIPIIREPRTRAIVIGVLIHSQRPFFDAVGAHERCLVIELDKEIGLASELTL